jgi:Flp pilus assembly protein TadD
LAAGRFDAAETQLLEVLQQDEDNVLILIDLAYSQAEQGRLSDAEINLRKALAGAPQNSQALYLMGYVKYRQDEFDAAFDSLSRAAQLDPGNARVQNLLGGTLMEKGHRAAAETAFRNAIRLQPGFAGPHYNLAFLYIKQNPPFVELARWHYEKAMDAGHPRVPDLEREIRDAGNQEVSVGP